MTSTASKLVVVVACGATFALVACVQALGLEQPTIRSKDGGVTTQDATPAPCGEITPSLDSIRACVLTTGCLAIDPPISVGSCVGIDNITQTGQKACLVEAKDCGDVIACLGTGAATADQCPEGSTQATCQKNLAIDCPSKAVFNCDVIGGTCTTYPQTVGGPANRAGCMVVSSCSGTGSSCSGTSAFFCRGGKGIGFDCAKSSSVCAVQNGSPGCYIKGPDCPDIKADVKCDGNKGVFCGSGGKVTVDCATSGLACVTDDKRGVYCLAPGCTIDEGVACDDSCSGTALTLCIGGVRHTIDCTEYGFTRCSEGDTEAQGETPKFHWATCR